MKIKYSNKVKKLLTPDDIKEIVQLSYSFIPYQKKQVYSFFQYSPSQTCILHRASNSNYENRILINRALIVDEDIILFRLKNIIYLFTESEYKNFYSIY